MSVVCDKHACMYVFSDKDDKSGSINNIARLFVSEMDVHLMSPPIDDSDEDADKDPQGFDLE